jgi:hypothetical protein
MIQIRPVSKLQPDCAYCKKPLKQTGLVWQGIHTLLTGICPKCKSEFFVDLPVGHALNYPFVIDKEKWKLFGSSLAEKWFGQPLLNSLKNPQEDAMEMVVEKKKSAKNVVVLNCLDYLYGHSLLKLLNAEKLIKERKNLVVIIPKFLKWMVPAGVAEVWVVDLPLKKAQNYYLDLQRQINQELKRFNRIFLSEAYSHPLDFEITNFTGIKIHDFEKRNYRVTFIWREDRPWFFSDYLVYGAKKINFLEPLIWWQNLKIRLLFYLLRRKLPNAKMTVAGIGSKTHFPKWIEDVRFLRPNSQEEKKLCQVYAESRVIIGVHGSNMLLPSAHAGMTLDLLPDIKIGLIASDVLYQQKAYDPRAISLTYRYVPVTIPMLTALRMVASMVNQRDEMLRLFENPQT